MSRAGEMPSCLHPPTSLSPPLSPASSSSIEYASRSMVASHAKMINERTSRYPTQKRSKDVRPIPQRGVAGTRRGQLQDEQSNDRTGEKFTKALSADDNNAWPVLVAVRCRPRKRQRAERRFGAESKASGYSNSSSSSSSDEKGGNYRSSSSNVQRGVFEYSACRDYDYAAAYDKKLPPPRARRPRRLYVQAPTHTGGSTSGRRSFDFDFIFPPWKKQRDVYETCALAQIRHVLQSQQQGQQEHTTIVAYGQTGTGKTYTMGMLSDFADDNERGMIPRALSQILEFAATTKDEADSSETVITLSFLQIYLETIQDLLALPGGSTSYATKRRKPRERHDERRSFNESCSDLPVRQGRDGAFCVTGLNEYEIASIDDAHALLELAMRNRVLAATTKNKTSSRSHTLLTISIKRRRRGATRSRGSASEDEDEELEEKDFVDKEEASTISFVDLAGSERVDGALHFLRATRARQEQRIREAKFINRSLSALGGVIAALAQPKVVTESTSAHVLARLNPSVRDAKLQTSVGNEHGQPHIRFRDSQLTKLLQGRLMGGRGRLLLIATVDDQPKNLSETLSTLKFAGQCRRVELQPGSRLQGDRNTRNLRRQKSLLDQVVNDMKIMHENREEALHSEYQARIEVLERELAAVRTAVQSSSLLSSVNDATSIHLASYTALCSLVDTLGSAGVDPPREITNHPRFVDFHSEKEVLEYVAGLYSQLKVSLTAQYEQGEDEHRLSSSTAPADTTELPKANLDQTLQAATCEDQDEGKLEELKFGADKQPAFRLPDTTDSGDTKLRRASAIIPLSADQEAEFRAVARHLITTHALDSIVLSSSDEDEDTTRPS